MRLRDSLARLGACALLGLAAFGGTAHAATRAGTPIENSAKLFYKVGGIDQDEVCSSPGGNSTKVCEATTFKVDNKVNLKVSTQETTPQSGTPGGTATMTFIVSNDGNSPQGFAFTTITNLTSGSVTSMFGGTGSVNDAFDPTACKIYNSTNLTVEIASVGSVDPDSSVTLKVVCEIPKGRLNAEIAAIALRARATPVNSTATLDQSATNLPGDIDIVFADVAGPNDGPRDAAHSARHAMRVNTAAIQVAKTFATICDPAGGAKTTSPAYEPKSIPGAYIQYTVTISNTGGGTAAILDKLEDALVLANVTFDGELITGANVAGAPACAATTASSNAGTAASTGNAFKVTWTGGARTSFTGGVKYLPATGNYNEPTISVNWASVLPIENGYTQAAELGVGDVLTLTYNVIIK